MAGVTLTRGTLNSLTTYKLQTESNWSLEKKMKKPLEPGRKPSVYSTHLGRRLGFEARHIGRRRVLTYSSRLL